MATSYSFRPIVTNGLILYLDSLNIKSYPGYGLTWSNLISSELNGYISGASFSNNLFVFDGVDDFIETDYIGSDNSSYTFGVWVRYSDFLPSEKSTLIRGRDGFGSGWSLSLDTSNDIFNGYYFRAGVVGDDESLSFAYANDDIPVIDNWYYLVGVWETGICIKLYINGDYKSQTSSLITTLRSSSTGWCLSSIESSVFSSGVVSNIQIYNRVLSNNEILQNYNAQKNRFI